MSLLDRCVRNEGRKPSFTEVDVCRAFGMVPRKELFDITGIACLALQYLFEAIPAFFVEWVNRLASSTVLASDLVCQARPLGKTSNLPELKDIRLVIPQSSLMGLLDCLLANHLGMFLDSHLPSPINHGALIGARPKTQVLDVTHVLQTAVEKAIDRKSVV